MQTIERATATRATGKRVLDAEDVLQWAYRHELPKLSRDTGRWAAEASSVSPMFRLAALGGRVDNWNREPGFPAAMGEAHPDALVIEAAVSGLSRFKDHDFEGDLGLCPDLGFAVDEHRAMRRAMGNIVGIVITCAKLGTRPTLSDAPTCGPTVAANGRPQILREQEVTHGSGRAKWSEMQVTPCSAERKGSYPQGAFCPLEWSTQPDSIVLDRAEYAAWWAALDLLASELTGKLSSISILAPSAPQRPWAGERELGKSGRVFEDVTARVYVREQREWAAAERLHARRRPRQTRPGSEAARVCPATSATPASAGSRR